MERRLLVDYEALLDELCRGLDPSNHATAVELARIPERIRGFGHVKEASVEHARSAWADLLAAFRGAPAVLQAAE
jgi:indolepyruvate ferredoxin oxidoreductase